MLYGMKPARLEDRLQEQVLDIQTRIINSEGNAAKQASVLNPLNPLQYSSSLLRYWPMNVQR